MIRDYVYVRVHCRGADRIRARVFDRVLDRVWNLANNRLARANRRNIENKICES